MLSPTPKQLSYLRRLGYRGARPTSSKQATAAITALEDGGTVAAAEKALLKQRKAERKEEEQEEKWYRKQRLIDAKAHIRDIIAQNRDIGHNYTTGFRLIPAPGLDVSAADEPYLNAFVPLKVAAEYPHLLALETLEYEEVTARQTLPRGTRKVLAPGEFTAYRKRGGCLGMILLAVLLAAVAVAAARAG